MKSTLKISVASLIVLGGEESGSFFWLAADTSGLSVSLHWRLDTRRFKEVARCLEEDKSSFSARFELTQRLVSMSAIFSQARGYSSFSILKDYRVVG
jgi:hypothetical protein